MTRIFLLLVTSVFLLKSAWAVPEITPAQGAEMLSMVREMNHGSIRNIAYQSTVLERMLDEANYFANQLKLPTKRPVQRADVLDRFVSLPSFSVIRDKNRFPDTIFGTNIFNATIPRDSRLRALKIGLYGRIDTTNFEFGFDQGKLVHVMRLSEPEVEYFARDLDKLVGQPSLIDTNSAYQLATQWLAAVSINVSALEKQFGHSVNQLTYMPRGASNSVLIPLFYVGFGTNNSPKWKPASYDPAVEVEILGTTKELQDLSVHDPSYCRRQAIIITNALDLVRTQNLPMQSSNSASSVGAGR